MPFVGYFAFRLLRAFRVLFRLVRDRKLARSLPWGYLRTLPRSNRYVQVQLLGIFMLLVALPLSFLLPLSVRTIVVYIVMVVALIAFQMPFFHRRSMS